MKIYVIGGSGKTGLEIIKQALAHEYKVTALLRNPTKFPFSHKNLTLVKGDVLKPESLKNTMVNHDAVISALGHKKFIIKSSILSEGTKNILAEMKSQKISRFICITSLGINDSKFKLGLYYTLFTIPFILYFYFKDKAKQENLIKASTTEWTIVRPGQLTNGKLTENYQHGKNVGHYLLTKMISRANVAHFILDILKNKKYCYQTPGITN